MVSRVRYEDVAADPLGHVKRIYSDLGLAEFEAARPALEEHIASVSGYQRNRLMLSKAQKAAVDQLWGPLIRDKGYTWPEEWLSLSA